MSLWQEFQLSASVYNWHYKENKTGSNEDQCATVAEFPGSKAWSKTIIQLNTFFCVNLFVYEI